MEVTSPILSMLHNKVFENIGLGNKSNCNYSQDKLWGWKVFLRQENMQRCYLQQAINKHAVNHRNLVILTLESNVPYCAEIKAQLFVRHHIRLFCANFCFIWCAHFYLYFTSWKICSICSAYRNYYLWLLVNVWKKNVIVSQRR